MRRQTYDQEKVSFNLIKYSKFGIDFELVVDPDLAVSEKNKSENSKEDIMELLKAHNVFSDAKKGVIASEEDVQKVFSTTDIYKIAVRMLKEGEIQLTSEYREKLRAEKRRKIINIIHRTTINPQTNLPHPATRIENALNEAKVKISEFSRAEDQVKDIIQSLKPIIPIKKDDTSLYIKLPLNYASNLRNVLIKYGEIKDENWTAQSFTCELVVPSGIKQDVIDELNSKTRGEVQINLER
ncbi:MAG: ribosome assembly factor SBDS [Candidatus Woesearchaeota archaeon]